jgi:hypothetical protein
LFRSSNRSNRNNRLDIRDKNNYTANKHGEKRKWVKIEEE